MEIHQDLDPEVEVFFEEDGVQKGHLSAQVNQAHDFANEILDQVVSAVFGPFGPEVVDDDVAELDLFFFGEQHGVPLQQGRELAPFPRLPEPVGQVEKYRLEK